MLVCSVDDDELRFFRTSGAAAWDRCVTLRAAELLSSEDRDRSAALEPLGKAELDALVVPDYWIGTASYALESRNRNVVDAFLTRKLETEHPAVDGIRDLFGYRFFNDAQGQSRLHVTFVQEPAAVTLHGRLIQAGFAPSEITSPALLWEARLREKLPAFSERGTALLHLLERECLQYFFDRGRFMFSRKIALPAAHEGQHGGLDEVVYEATQSLHLYSQKARAEIEAVYVLTERADAPAAMERLAERLGGEVIDLAEHEELAPAFRDVAAMDCLDSGLHLLATSRAARGAGVMHRTKLREREWLPVQRAGIAAGLVCAAVLAGVRFELHQLDESLRGDPPGAGERARRNKAPDLDALRDAVDLLTERGERSNVSALLADVAASMPADMILRELRVEVGEPGAVSILGSVDAPHTDSLQSTLDRLLAGLHTTIPGSAGIGVRDIRVSRAGDGEPADAASRRGFDVELEFGIR